MTRRKLRKMDGTAYANIPKGDLEEDGLVEDGEIVDDQGVAVDRLDDRCYLVRLPTDDGELPELTETEVVQREVAVALRESGAFDQALGASPPHAD